jgi:hypothetical protein
MKRRLRLIVALAAFATLAGLAEVGGARPGVVGPGGDATIYAQEIQLEPGQTGDNTALCPGNMRAVSGGVGSTTANPPAHQIQMSAPIDDTGRGQPKAGAVAHGWTASVLNYGTIPGTFRVYAICSATSDAIVEVQTFTLGEPGHNVDYISADCAPGSHASGGGIATSGTLSPAPDYVTTSHPATGTFNAWFAGAVQFVAGVRTYTVFALCSANTDATAVQAEVSLPAKGSASRAVGCPVGMRAIGGGARIQNYGYGKALIDSAPTSRSAGVAPAGLESARGWTAAAVNVTDTAEALRTYALCVTEAPPVPKPKSKLTVSGFSVGKAQAGRSFTVSFTVRSSGKGVKGSLSCSAKLNGKQLSASHRSTSSSGRASCSWNLPRSSSGERLAGSISESYRGAKVSRSFSVKVA